MTATSNEIVHLALNYFDQQGIQLKKFPAPNQITYKFTPVPTFKLEMILKKAHRSLNLEERRAINFPREEDGTYYLYKNAGHYKWEIGVNPYERTMQFRRL